MSNKDDEITQIFLQGLYKDIYKTLDKEKDDRLESIPNLSISAIQREFVLGYNCAKAIREMIKEDKENANS